MIIPGSKVGTRESETGKEEKSGEGCDFSTVSAGAKCLIFPPSFRITCVKDEILSHLSLSPDHVH